MFIDLPKQSHKEMVNKFREIGLNVDANKIELEDLIIKEKPKTPEEQQYIKDLQKKIKDFRA